MTQQLILGLSQYGLIIVIVNVLLDQIGLPVPAVPTLIVAGALAADGHMPLSGLFAGAVFACLVPDCGWSHLACWRWLARRRPRHRRRHRRMPAARIPR